MNRSTYFPNGQFEGLRDVGSAYHDHHDAETAPTQPPREVLEQSPADAIRY